MILYKSGHIRRIYLHSSFYIKNALKAAVIAVILTVFVCTGQGCSPTLAISDESVALEQIQFESLSVKTRQIIQNLEYSNEAAGEFIEMVYSWKDKHGRPLLANWNRKLTVAKRNYEQQKISKRKLAGIEAGIAEKICYKIRKEIRYDEKFFRLEDIAKNKKAQCLGYSQVFYILGKSIDLSIIPINAVELQDPGPLPTGQAHVSCMINLPGDKIIMLNLVPGGFISWQFILDEHYSKIGNYRKLKNPDNPLGIFRKIQLLDEDGLAAYIYNNQGTDSAAAGQYEKAISEYSKAVNLNPNLAEVYSNRGIAYRNTDQLEQAVADYTKAIELNPNLDEAYNNRGVANIKLGLLHKAISDFTRAIELNPKLAEAYNNRANTYVRLRQFEPAISDYTKAIKRKSNFARAYGNRALTYALLGKSEGAKKDLIKAVKLSPALKSYAETTSSRFNLNLNLD